MDCDFLAPLVDRELERHPGPQWPDRAPYCVPLTFQKKVLVFTDVDVQSGSILSTSYEWHEREVQKAILEKKFGTEYENLEKSDPKNIMMYRYSAIYIYSVFQFATRPVRFRPSFIPDSELPSSLALNTVYRLEKYVGRGTYGEAYVGRAAVLPEGTSTLFLNNRYVSLDRVRGSSSSADDHAGDRQALPAPTMQVIVKVLSSNPKKRAPMHGSEVLVPPPTSLMPASARSETDACRISDQIYRQLGSSHHPEDLPFVHCFENSASVTWTAALNSFEVFSKTVANSRNGVAFSPYSQTQIPLKFAVWEYGGKALDQDPPSSLREVLQVLESVTKAIVLMAEADIVHRDLKIPNLVWDAERRVRVIDYSLSRRLGTEKRGGWRCYHSGRWNRAKLLILALERLLKSKGVLGRRTGLNPERDENWELFEAWDQWSREQLKAFSSSTQKKFIMPPSPDPLTSEHKLKFQNQWTSHVQTFPEFAPLKNALCELESGSAVWLEKVFEDLLLDGSLKSPNHGSVHGATCRVAEKHLVLEERELERGSLADITFMVQCEVDEVGEVGGSESRTREFSATLGRRGPWRYRSLDTFAVSRAHQNRSYHEADVEWRQQESSFKMSKESFEKEVETSEKVLKVVSLREDIAKDFDMNHFAISSEEYKTSLDPKLQKSCLNGLNSWFSDWAHYEIEEKMWTSSSPEEATLNPELQRNLSNPPRDQGLTGYVEALEEMQTPASSLTHCISWTADAAPWEAKRYMVEFAGGVSTSFDMVSLGVTLTHLLSDYFSSFAEQAHEMIRSSQTLPISSLEPAIQEERETVLQYAPKERNPGKNSDPPPEPSKEDEESDRMGLSRMIAMPSNLPCKEIKGVERYGNTDILGTNPPGCLAYSKQELASAYTSAPGDLRLFLGLLQVATELREPDWSKRPSPQKLLRWTSRASKWASDAAERGINFLDNSVGRESVTLPTEFSKKFLQKRTPLLAAAIRGAGRHAGKVSL